MTARRAKIVVIALLVLGLLGGLALVTVRAQRESRAQLEERFALRSALGANFTSSYVQSVVVAERRRAEAMLAAPQVHERQFRAAVDALGFHAAVLLDSHGRVLRAWPAKRGLIGSDLGGKYPHLRTAVAGRAAVSNVVFSAAEGRPVVAFATPFRSTAGRRVLSGAFGVEGTPLAAFLSTALPFRGGELTLIDSKGALVIDRGRSGGITRLAAVDGSLATAAAARSRGHYVRAGETRFFARHAVAGTPWTVLVSVPTEQLLEPISGSAALVPWILFAAFAAAAAAAAYLVWRLAEHRAQLALSNDRLAQSNKELRELDRLKDEFVALVSHELRTPLTSIIGYISALKRGRAGVVPTEQRRLLDVAERNAQRLLGLICDLLLAAKADAGKLELETEQLDLAVLLRHSVESAHPAAEEQGVDLKFASAAAVSLVADRARLLQVFDNLISNAIKFTPAGGSVHVSLSAGQTQVAIEIRDDGIGIPAGEQQQLYNRFFRASTATSREIPGTGLGLSIVKTIIELHDGKIECRSAEGAGTTFVVTLPVAAAVEEAA